MGTPQSIGNQSIGEMIRAVVLIVLMFSFVPVTGAAAVWIASSLDPGPAVLALVAVAGLALTVAGAVATIGPQMTPAPASDVLSQRGLASRTSAALAEISRQLRIASDETEWTSRVAASIRISADRLEMVSRDLDSSSEKAKIQGLGTIFNRQIQSMAGLALIWCGTLAQGVAAWWAAS